MTEPESPIMKGPDSVIAYTQGHIELASIDVKLRNIKNEMELLRQTSVAELAELAAMKKAAEARRDTETARLNKQWEKLRQRQLEIKSGSSPGHPEKARMFTRSEERAVGECKSGAEQRGSGAPPAPRPQLRAQATEYFDVAITKALEWPQLYKP